MQRIDKDARDHLELGQNVSNVCHMQHHLSKLRGGLMTHLSKFGHVFKFWIFWLLQFYVRIRQYTSHIPKFHGTCENP